MEKSTYTVYKRYTLYNKDSINDEDEYPVSPVLSYFPVRG